MRQLRTILFLAAALTLSSCGFQPLYGDFGEGAENQAVLSAVEVEAITGEPGRERMRAQLANDLADLHGLGANSSDVRFGLSIHLTETFAAMGIRPDGAATREQYRLNAEYVLKDNISGESVDTGSLNIRNTYDVVLSDFSNFSARQDAAMRSTQEIARALAIRISTMLAGSDEETIN